MTHITFRKNLKDFLSATGYPALFLLSIALLAALHTSCNRNDDHPSGKFLKGEPVKFTVSGGGASAATKKSSAQNTSDALSSGASLSLSSVSGADLPEFSEQEGLSSVQTCQIYYDFVEGKNVASPAGISVAGGGSLNSSADGLVQSSDTKFSGEVFTVSSQAYERVDWVSGDNLTIGEAYSGDMSDYMVDAVDDVDESSSDTKRRRTGSIKPLSGNGLQWHNDEHGFISVYPSLSQMGFTSSNSSVTLTASASANVMQTSATGSDEFVIMPSNQLCTYVAERTYKGLTPKTTKLEKWYSPNMQYAYMASGFYTSAPNETVNLSYYPCYSAVEVKLVKPDVMTSTVRLKEAVLTAGCGSGDVISDVANITLEEASGITQKVTWSKTGQRPDIAYDLEGATASAVKGNTVTVTFLDQTGTPVSPELDEVVPVSFTFLMLPEKITQLVLTLKLEVEGSADQTKSIKLQTIDRSGTKSWIPLDKYKKLTVTNLSLPGVEYHITTPYNISHVGHNAFTSSNFVIDSYKLDRSVSPAVKTAEPDIVIEYSPGYAPEDTPDEPSSISETDWSLSSPSWLGGGSGLAKQSADLTYNASISYQNNFVNTTDPIDYVDYQTNRLRANGTVGSREAPVDLCMQRTWPQGGSYERPAGQPVTSNCYVVRAAGWYMLPLIYGNAIDYTKNTNISAYVNDGGNVVSYRKERSSLSMEYLHTRRPSLFDESDYSNRLIRGFGLWEDTDGSAPVLVNNSVEIVAWNEIQNATTSGLGVRYMRFYIDPANIKQCNILLAVSLTNTLTDEENIYWSWHIWVTPEDLTPVNLKSTYTKVIDWNTNPPRTMQYSREVNTMPVPLGWCDDKSVGGLSVKKYNDWGDCWVRVYQRGRKESTMAYFKISHRGDASSAGSVIRSGDCTAYNWGRKDPFVPYKGNYLKKNHCPTGRFAEKLNEQTTNGSPIRLNVDDYRLAISASVKHPYAITNTKIPQSGGNGYYENWAEIKGWIWNGGYTSIGDYQGSYASHKTVFDPCPPDYSVPSVPFDFSSNEPSNMTSDSFIGSSYVDGMTIYRFKRYPGDTSDGFAIPEVSTIKDGGYDSNKAYFWTCVSSSVSQAWYVYVTGSGTLGWTTLKSGHYMSNWAAIYPGLEVK